jgi:cysteinyl-tRNA synthetase
MSIHLYNTLTRQMEPLIPRESGKVAMYVCGVTPYDFPHMGNARAVVAFDTIRRYLEYRGLAVFYVQNFTDIDDKIIARAHEQGVVWSTLPERFIQVYFEEMDALNVKRATIYPRATENIDEIIALIAGLQARGHAYVVGGDVYYAVRTFPTYGALSNRNLEEMQAGARVEVSERKRDPLDFALWKAAKPGEPSWESPWGLGRPGWHIECSAMALKFMGPGFDIHGGGQDLIFPHHENEIAQSEGSLDDAIFARYWLHNGFVTINQEKMSKSLGNFFTVRDVLARYAAPVVRFFLTAAHYRSPVDFSDQALDQAKAAYERLKVGLATLARLIASPEVSGATAPEARERLRATLASAEGDFVRAMDDDFNTPQALAVLYSLLSEANRLIGDPGFVADEATRVVLSDTRGVLLRLAGTLGIVFDFNEGFSDTLVPDLLALLLEVRTQARANKQYALADRVRARLLELGVVIEDTPQGTIWRRA